MNLHFTYVILLSYFLSLSVSKLSQNWIRNTAITSIEIKIAKISRLGSISSGKAKFDHFTMLSCRERQRNVSTKNYNARAQPALFCSLILFFSDALFRCRRGFVNSLLAAHGIAAPPGARQTHSHARMLTCFAFFPRDFRAKDRPVASS